MKISIITSCFNRESTIGLLGDNHLKEHLCFKDG